MMVYYTVMQPPPPPPPPPPQSLQLLPQFRFPFAKTLRKMLTMSDNNPWSVCTKSLCVILPLVCLVALIPFGSSLTPSNTVVERSINTFTVENDPFAGNMPSLGNAWSVMPNQTSPCRHSFYEGTIQTHAITHFIMHHHHHHHLPHYVNEQSLITLQHLLSPATLCCLF